MHPNGPAYLTGELLNTALVDKMGQQTNHVSSNSQRLDTYE